VNLVGLNVDEFSGTNIVDLAINNDGNGSFQDIEIFLHFFMVMGTEILAGHELYQGEIHSGALHKICGPVIAEAVFPVFFINDKHIYSFIIPSCIFPQD
jgi:hypothetical protein